MDVYTRRQDPCYPTVVDFADRARVVHLPAGPAAPYSKHRVWDHLPEFVDGVQDFISENARCNTTSSTVTTGLSGWVAMRLSPRPLISPSCTCPTPWVTRKTPRPSFPGSRSPAGGMQVERQVLQGSDALVAESPASKQHMVRHYDVDPAERGGDPLRRRYVGRFQPRGQTACQGRPVVACPRRQSCSLSGACSPSKGIDTLLQAAAEIRRDYPDVCVLVVGGGLDDRDEQETAELRPPANSWGRRWDCNVHYVKAQPQEKLAQYYAAADVFVMPSHYESFGMVVLEAMACGTPVVGVRSGRPVLHHRRRRFRLAGSAPGDWRAFAQAVSRLLASPRLQGAMRQAGPERARAFAWPRVVDENMRLYRRLILQQSTLTPTARHWRSCPAGPPPEVSCVRTRAAATAASWRAGPWPFSTPLASSLSPASQATILPQVGIGDKLVHALVFAGLAVSDVPGPEAAETGRGRGAPWSALAVLVTFRLRMPGRAASGIRERAAVGSYRT